MNLDLLVKRREKAYIRDTTTKLRATMKYNSNYTPDPSTKGTLYEEWPTKQGNITVNFCLIGKDPSEYFKMSGKAPTGWNDYQENLSQTLGIIECKV